MFVSRSPQEFISNDPALPREVLAMVLISFSAQSLPRPIRQTLAPPPQASVASARHALPAFLPCGGVRITCIQVYRRNSTKKRGFIFLISHTPQIISFPPFLSSYSAATAGHKNGVEGHKNGVQKPVSVTRAEWRSHERSERDRSPVASKSQKRSAAGIWKCSENKFTISCSHS